MSYERDRIWVGWNSCQGFWWNTASAFRFECERFIDKFGYRDAGVEAVPFRVQLDRPCAEEEMLDLARLGLEQQ